MYDINLFTFHIIKQHYSFENVVVVQGEFVCLENILMFSEFCSQDFSVNKTLVITVMPCEYDRNHVLCGIFN